MALIDTEKIEDYLIKKGDSSSLLKKLPDKSIEIEGILATTASNRAVVLKPTTTWAFSKREKSGGPE